MSDIVYRLKLVKENQEIEVQGDKNFVLEMLETYNAAALKPGSVPVKQAVSAERKDNAKQQSVAEFIRQLGSKKHTDLVLAFGYYLEKYSSVSEFTPADINNAYYDAKRESSNTSMMINYNIKKGYMMEAKGHDKKGKKKYTLTKSGEEYVEAMLKQQVE